MGFFPGGYPPSNKVSIEYFYRHQCRSIDLETLTKTWLPPSRWYILIYLRRGELSIRRFPRHNYPPPIFNTSFFDNFLDLLDVGKALQTA